MKNFIFTYGTLQKGQRANGILAGQEFLGHGTTEKKYTMAHLGSFPVIAPNDDGHAVKGEVYSVSDELMDRLDMYEAYPHLYGRSQIDITLERGDVVTAWVYEGNDAAKAITKTNTMEPVEGVLSWPL